MKTLIKNDFLYYYKNKSKLLLSILFILSLVGMIFVYDNFELTENRRESLYPTQYSIEYSSSLKFDETCNDYTGECELDLDSLKYRFFQANPDKYTEDFWKSEEGKNLIQLAIREDETITKLANRLLYIGRDYKTLLYRDRRNTEVTPFRYELVKARLNILDYFEDSPFKEILIEESAYDDQDILLQQLEKYQILMDTLTPDDFNEYTITLSNLPSRMFEGLYLLVILIFVLLLFYDLFSRDFDNRTYRTIYSGPYPRVKVISAKLLFAVLYTFLCILIGFMIGALYLLLVTRTAYNTTPHRRGYILHPNLMDVNPLSLFKKTDDLTIIPHIVRNIISILTGSSLIILWISFIAYISFKLKSSSSALTVGAFFLLALFFVNMFAFKDYFALIIPLFAYNYNYILSGDSLINFYYIIIISILITSIIYFFFFKDIKTMDLLDGDGND